MVLLYTWNGAHEFLTRWSPAAEWAVAIGTIALAAATFTLARRAHQEAKRVGESIKLQTKQQSLDQRPIVYPTTTKEWWASGGITYTAILVRNGGRGVAFNVEGSVQWPSPTSGANDEAVQTVRATLAAGEAREVSFDFPGATRKTVVWDKVRGSLSFSDSENVQWRTDFRYRKDVDNISAEVEWFGPEAEYKSRSETGTHRRRWRRRNI